MSAAPPLHVDAELPVESEAPSPKTVRRVRTQALLADLLTELVEDVRTAEGGEAIRATRTMQGVLQHGQELLAVLAGAPRGRSRLKSGSLFSGSSYDDDLGGEDDLQPAFGAYGVNMGGAQLAENHGTRALNEIISLSRAYITMQGRPKLSDLMSAYTLAKEANDTGMVEALSAKLAADYGVNVPPPAIVLQEPS